MRSWLPTLALALTTTALGCKAASTTPRSFDVAPGRYADGEAGLKALWTDILDAATHDEREHVHDLMASMILTDAELKALLGPRAEPLLPKYKSLIGTLVNIGALELCAQVYERKYDTIDVFPDDKDAHVEPLLVTPHKLWSVRVRKKSDTLGLRYDFFVYLDGRWRTGNQLGKAIDVVKGP
jgi:hypothetical protein